MKIRHVLFLFLTIIVVGFGGLVIVVIQAHNLLKRLQNLNQVAVAVSLTRLTKKQVLSVLGLVWALKQPLYTSQDITADVTRNNNLKEVA